MDAKDLMIGNWVKCCKRYMKVTKLAEDMDCDDIAPIPLTPEILEKNGMIHNVSKQSADIFYFSIEGELAYIQVKCRYVHQLQHALRLCGIEKEITI